MTDTLEYRWIKTRKTHKCFACFEEIPPDTEAVYQTVVDSGNFYHTYMCEICQRYAQEIDQPVEIEEGRYAQGTPHREQINQMKERNENGNSER